MSAEKARRVLDALLDRLERQPVRTNRLADARLPECDGLDDREAFEAVLGDARRMGAVSTEGGGRGARHLIARVVVEDADALYRFLGRVPLSRKVDERMERLRRMPEASLPEIAGLLDRMEADWRAARLHCRLRVEDDRTEEFLRCLGAVLGRAPEDQRDLRTFSIRTTGDSKAIERHAGAIAAWHRETGRFPGTADDQDVLTALGLEKFQHPVLIAGPVRSGGLDASALPYAGFPPEALAGLEPTGPVHGVLTVENLASFNRHVREVGRDGTAVVYTGGFPSRAAMQAIRIVSAWSARRFHWGDVDPSGVGIALHLRRNCPDAPGDLRPHLMDASLARVRGKPAPACPGVGGEGTAFEALAGFLGSADACRLEQEEIDPAPLPSALSGTGTGAWASATV